GAWTLHTITYIERVAVSIEAMTSTVDNLCRLALAVQKKQLACRPTRFRLPHEVQKAAHIIRQEDHIRVQSYIVIIASQAAGQDDLIMCPGKAHVMLVDHKVQIK